MDFVSEKAKAQDAVYAKYVSTENMQADFGGVAIAATVPKSGSVTKFNLGDTLFSNIRTYFKKVWLAEFDGYCSNDVLVFRTKDEIVLHPGFLNGICRWEKFTEFSIRTSKGAKMPRGDKDALAQFKFELPSIEEQRAIAKTIRCFDNKIDLNRRINQTLEAMAQAIFKSWFVDFDPVKAKIAAIEQGEDSQRAAMRAISGKTDAELDQMPREHHDQLAATVALFPDAMEESDLGDIPKGWTHGVLGDVCSFTAGSAFKPEYQGSTEGDYPFIKVSDMNLAGNEVFIQSANNYVSKAQQSEMKAKLHPIGATVFAKIGVALISNRRRLLTAPTIIDNNLMSASPVDGKSGVYFLYSMLSAIDFNTLVSGTALPYLNVSDLKKIPIVRPSHDVNCDFERKASSIFSMMQALTEQSSTLADTRDNLLPKLLSGEVEIYESLEG
ncbi:restriction endonuclease subunit S [Stenotrophomonas sp. C2852]|uniref:restriction endonuclease subunit S n=1 Tax=Stenotrophomonas sp. C2852 TaxID=3077845 RepID=UPI00293CC6D5|nr:restriction endonuclease subunit S [Stenotrophomonas sp. C2852]MDV3435662.1 restriction endonuclease subunit S [Stenotrophomonas sp. C2852]